MAAARRNPSSQAVPTAAIAVGSAFDTIPPRYHLSVEAGSSAEKEGFTHFGQGVSDEEVAGTVEEEEEMCGLSDARYLLQSPEQISFEDSVQLSLSLPEEQDMEQPYDPIEIFPSLPTWRGSTFRATQAKPPT
ncbi:hypothetical protein SUGI_0297500 [Cryptomeria japonica]|nr:hypothetical protein SUGI_0297500 [Cryptomeria japonica]